MGTFEFVGRFLLIDNTKALILQNITFFSHYEYSTASDMYETDNIVLFYKWIAYFSLSSVL